MKRMLAVFAVLLVACVGTAVIPLLSVACWRGQVPQWVVWCAAPFVIAGMVMALRPLMPLTKRSIREDGSLPWREFRAARRLELVANGDEDVSLVLEFVRERLDEVAVRVRFDGVVSLTVTQPWSWVVSFDGLVCEELSRVAKDGSRFAIGDPHGEAIAFRCRAFAQVTANAERPDSARALPGRS